MTESEITSCLYSYKTMPSKNGSWPDTQINPRKKLKINHNDMSKINYDEPDITTVGFLNTMSFFEC